ncbi:MAG: rhodanese-like domain-containing protein [Candidatus Solibacter sp.]
MRRLTILVVTTLAVGLAAELALIQPGEVAAQLAAKGTKPVLFHVGPNLLYRGKHIPGSIYAGPGSRAEGLEALKVAAGKLPRDREIILYCGCCPWSNCPNVKPAVDALKQMGFSHVKAMYVESNFAKDWIDKGYPVELGSAKQ